MAEKCFARGIFRETNLITIVLFFLAFNALLQFGYAPKGSSVIMYSSNEYIHYQYYVAADWSGGIFVSPTMAGSRSGGIIAATWATLMNHGLDGYTKTTKEVVSTLQWMVQE